MKNLIKKSILFVAIVATVVSYASGPSAKGRKSDVKKTVILLNNVKPGQQLLIKDYDDAVLYHETIESEGIYSKVFDLSILPSGNYYFEVEKDIEFNIIPFKVSSDKVEVFKEKENNLYKPFVRSKANKVYLSRMSLNEQPLKVNIYFDGVNGEELILSEALKNKRIIERIYTLDEHIKGLYKIVVSTEGKTFSYNVILK